MADVNLISSVGDFTNPYQQTYPDTCAIKSQQLIMNDFGIPITEDQCVAYSVEHGWYTGDGTGTSPQDVGKLLVDSGIPCSQRENANVYDLANELAQGHKVIVGVDSGELWNNSILDWLKDIFMGNTPDHALIVAGIDMSDPNNPMVMLTDPGTGECAKPYPLSLFMDAWADSNCFMVSTDVAAPQQTEQMVANGLDEGHLAEVANVDYDTFTQFQDYSHQIDYPTQGAQLYDMFQSYPQMDIPFDNAIAQWGLPAFDPNLTMPVVSNNIDPFSFNYIGLNDMSWMDTTAAFDTGTEISDLQNHLNTLDKMQENLDFAQEHAQQCMDDGMYISATMWQNQAHQIEGDIQDFMNTDC